jgi:hypothetical protein
MQPPPIPVIQDDELLDAVSALTRAACVMRALFLHVAEGESAIELLKKHDDLATLAEAVIGEVARASGYGRRRCTR